MNLRKKKPSVLEKIHDYYFIKILLDFTIVVSELSERKWKILFFTWIKYVVDYTIVGSELYEIRYIR